MIRRGVHVYDKADPRHVGRVESVCWTDMHANRGLARVRWLETDWQSTVPVSALRISSRIPVTAEERRGRFEFPVAGRRWI